MPETETAPLTMLALSPADPASWRWWPGLIARMRETLPQLDPDLPVDRIIGFIGQQAIQMPLGVRWWVAVREAVVVGHAIAWVDVSWGEPYILVHQLVAEAGARELLPAWLMDLAAWAQTLNATYEQAGSPLRVRELRFWSARSNEGWDRLLNGLVTKTFHVKHIPLHRLEAVPRGTHRETH